MSPDGRTIRPAARSRSGTTDTEVRYRQRSVREEYRFCRHKASGNHQRDLHVCRPQVTPRRGCRRYQIASADRPRIGAPHSSVFGRCRPALVSERRRLPTRRRSFDPRVGRVATRGGVVFSAVAIRCARRSRASSRFRNCDRSSDAATRMTDPRRSIKRSCSWGGKAVDAEISNRASARVFDVLACCPPGPPDAEKVQLISDIGIVRRRLIRRSSPSGGSSLIADAYCMRDLAKSDRQAGNSPC